MKIIRTAFAAFLLLMATGLSAQDLVVPYEQFTLPNGLNVILHKDNTIPRLMPGFDFLNPIVIPEGDLHNLFPPPHEDVQIPAG